MEASGRWSLVERAAVNDDDLEIIAWALLRRWGVVFRRVLDREGPLPPVRDLLRVYRRLEARGEIRGGRFVEGFSGEQFALPEAVGSLRKTRREKKCGTLISVSGADPLNVVGILTPGKRVPAVASNRILFRDGVPIATLVAGEIQYLEDAELSELGPIRNALVRRAGGPPIRYPKQPQAGAPSVPLGAAGA